MKKQTFLKLLAVMLGVIIIAASLTTGTSTTTGDSVLMLAALFFVSGAGVFGTAKALKNR